MSSSHVQHFMYLCLRLSQNTWRISIASLACNSCLLQKKGHFENANEWNSQKNAWDCLTNIDFISLEVLLLLYRGDILMREDSSQPAISPLTIVFVKSSHLLNNFSNFQSTLPKRLQSKFVLWIMQSWHFGPKQIGSTLKNLGIFCRFLDVAIKKCKVWHFSSTHFILKKMFLNVRDVISISLQLHCEDLQGL